ncbi:TPA: tail fiber assembly protein, partial [Citrobacter gillenii]
ANGAGFVQRYTAFDGSGMAYRVKETKTDPFEGWITLYSTANKPAAADVDAVSASKGGTFQKEITSTYTGGTMWTQQYDTKAPYYQNVSLNTGTSAVIPLIKQKYTLNDSAGGLIATGVAGVGVLLDGAEGTTPATLSMFLVDADGVVTELSLDPETKILTAPGEIAPGSWDNFDERYQRLNTASMAKNGWTKDSSNGRIDQWGTTGTLSDDSPTKVTYPIAFPEQNFNFMPTLQRNATPSDNTAITLVYGADNANLTDATVVFQSNSQISDARSGVAQWLAIGQGAPVTATRLLTAIKFDSKYCYSATNNAFYATQLYLDYQHFKTWPDDAQSVDDSVYEEFAENSPPDGKYRVAGADGQPAWADIPAPTQERALEKNVRTFNTLLRATNDAAFPLQSALNLGIITPEQQSMLTSLQQFSVELANTDLTNTPVTWPAQPAGIKLPI